MAQDASEGRLGVISRRGFWGAIGLCFWRRPIVLEAIAAEKMPHRLRVRGVKSAAIFELRDYGSAAPRLSMKPVWSDGGRFLFAFGSLEERERAWREAEVTEGVREIAVYRSL